METRGDDRLLLRPRVTSTLGLLLVCSIFVSVGVWLAIDGKVIGWISSCFFGLGVVVAVVELLPNASYLLLTGSGLKVRTMYRSWSLSWNEIAYFTTATIHHNRMVVFNFSDNCDRAKITRRFAKLIGGFEGALPNNYGMKPDELADLLNEWKKRFAEDSRMYQ